jgi:hypothetical protein
MTFSLCAREDVKMKAELETASMSSESMLTHTHTHIHTHTHTICKVWSQVFKEIFVQQLADQKANRITISVAINNKTYAVKN